MSGPLSGFQEAFVLSHFPAGTRITFTGYLQEMVPCPIQVRLALPSGDETQVVLRIARNRGGVEWEALLFPVLAQCGLPVPLVLAGPVSNPTDVPAGSMSLHSLLPGRTLQAWSEYSQVGLELAKELVVEAITRLHQLTDRLLQEEVGRLLPHKTLASELRGLLNSGHPWMQEPVARTAVSRLVPIVEEVTTPLVFSNGDYQPANFLAEHGQLTGFVDFEKACFEDPLYTLARYPVYNLNPLYQAGIVERFLKEHGFSEADMASRMVLFCLRTLVTKVPVTGGTLSQQQRRDYVLDVLRDGLASMGG
jgi:hypothetical protein